MVPLSPSLVDKIDGLLCKKYYVYFWRKKYLKSKKRRFVKDIKTKEIEKAATDKCENLYPG